MNWSDVKDARNEIRARIMDLKNAIVEAEDLLDELPSSSAEYADMENDEVQDAMEDADAFLESTEDL